MALELIENALVFSFPDVHPEAKVSIQFVRTLRIPDDESSYSLPPGLGTFPVRHVDDFSERVPMRWKEHGGVMLPMYQSEAMWLRFEPHAVAGHGGDPYPFAIKIATGKRSAVTGDEWSNDLRQGDYCIVPKQPWLDGYVIDKENVRQFVAATLGMGFTAEEQITGKAEVGGIQVEVMPMKREVFERRFPKREVKTSGILRSAMGMKHSLSSGPSYATMDSAIFGSAIGAPAPDMGLAAGGRMKQTVYADPYDFEDWDRSHHGRCFVHLANSLAWRAITQQEAPPTPVTAAEYTRHGFPWFEYYDDGRALEGTKTLQGLKSVMQLGFQKGFSILPENERPEFKSDQIIVLKHKSKDEVREGRWA